MWDDARDVWVRGICGLERTPRVLAFAVTQPLAAGQVNARLEEILRRLPDHYTPDGRLRKEKVAVEAEMTRPGPEKPLGRLDLEEEENG